MLLWTWFKYFCPCSMQKSIKFFFFLFSRLFQKQFNSYKFYDTCRWLTTQRLHIIVTEVRKMSQRKASLQMSQCFIEYDTDTSWIVTVGWHSQLGLLGWCLGVVWPTSSLRAVGDTGVLHYDIQINTLECVLLCSQFSSNLRHRVVRKGKRRRRKHHCQHQSSIIIIGKVTCG